MKTKKKSNVRVQSETEMKTKMKSKRNKTKLKEVFTEKSKNTDLDTGEVSSMSTRQVDKYKQRGDKNPKKKTTLKEVFAVRDKDGKLLVKQKRKNNRVRLRTTRKGRKAGY